MCCVNRYEHELAKIYSPSRPESVQALEDGIGGTILFGLNKDGRLVNTSDAAGPINESLSLKKNYFMRSLVEHLASQTSRAGPDIRVIRPRNP